MSLATPTPLSARPNSDSVTEDPLLDSSPTRPRITSPRSPGAALSFVKPRSRLRLSLRTQQTSTTSPSFNNSNMGNPTTSHPNTAAISPQSQPTAIIHAFPSRLSNTTVYIVVDPVTEEAAIINPVLDLDPLTNEIRTRSADRLLKFVNDEGLTIKWILETALHRNRISACRYVQLMLRHIGDGVMPKVCVGENSFCTCGEDDYVVVDDDTASRNTSASQKSPDAFDKLFEDGEQLHLGNIIAQCEHLDDHEGITYTFGQNIFSSTGVTHTSAATPLNVINHPEPPPERTSTGPVSSRQSMTIDEVLGSAEKMSLTNNNSNNSSSNGSSEETGPTPSPSPLLAFYAEQVNTRGGRIPKKINLPPAERKASLGEAQSQGDLNGNGKGKERERNYPQPTPLRIPRKLGVIMC